jgi:hypothetical protein
MNFIIVHRQPWWLVVTSFAEWNGSFLTDTGMMVPYSSILVYGAPFLSFKMLEARWKEDILNYFGCHQLMLIFASSCFKHL